MSRLSLLFLLMLSGCETVHEFAHKHPVATGIGGAFVVGSLIASGHGSRDQRQPVTANHGHEPCARVNCGG